MFLRNTIVLAGLESTYGTAATLTGADAILLSDVSIRPLVANNVDRTLVRGFFGGNSQLLGTTYAEVTCTVELAGSGTATTPPKWGRLLQAMGFAQTIGAASVDYTPVSTFGASSSLTMRYFLDGLLMQLTGARGTATIAMGVGERPELRCRFVGLYSTPTATANPTPDYAAFRPPVAVTDTNTSDLLIGNVTYTAGTGTVAGGTPFVGAGVQLDLRNDVVFQPLVGRESVLITQRDVAGSFTLDLDPAQVVTAMADVRANTLSAFGITHGTTAGNIIALHAPSFQRIDPTVEDLDGVAMSAFALRLLPLVGNDELRIVVR
jgi:hypothetical protein